MRALKSEFAWFDEMERRFEEHERRMAEDPDYRRAEEEKVLVGWLRQCIRDLDDYARTLRDRPRHLTELGVPRKDSDAIAYGRLQDTKALRLAREFAADDEAVVLVLSGGRGCGKTVAAGWLVAKLGGRFMDVSELARVNRYDDAEMRQLERLRLLAIDDLGMEFADKNGAFLATFDGLFNRRYADQCKTVITTNLPAAEFKRRYGERVADRIRECGRFEEISGKSMRVK